MVRMPGVDMQCPPERVESEEKLAGNAAQESELQVKINSQGEQGVGRAGSHILMKAIETHSADVEFWSNILHSMPKSLLSVA